MKTIIYTILLFSTLNLAAQPVIGPDAMIILGEEEPTMFIPIDEINWNSGSAGENLVWDFSALPTGNDCNYNALDPMESPFYDSFPNSDIYFLCTFSDSQGFTTEQHTFYNIDNDILQLVGNVSISISNPNFDSIFIVFTDPLDWGTFPYSYLGTSIDDFEARVTSYIGNQVILAIQSGTSTHEVDSYGTLTTPSGTFENTIRVKRTELAENSIPGIPFSSPQESYRYTWYSENENGVILNLDSIVVKDFNGNVVNTSYTGSYRIQGPTITSTYFPIETNITIYPNPTSEEINIEVSNISNYTIELYSINGQKQPYSLISQSDNSCRIKLDHHKYPDGTYLLNLIENESNIKISKSIVIKQ